MAAIATEAGVALKTVYVAFATKRGVLRALWHLLLRGDQEDVPVAERRWYREVLDAPDPERQLRLNARNSRVVKQRAAALMEVIRTAAPTDPDIQALWSRIQTEFYANQRLVVEALHARGALRPDLDVIRANDILWALNHPDVWRLLVGERGWTPAQYEQWFADTMCAQLLGGREREGRDEAADPSGGAPPEESGRARSPRLGQQPVEDEVERPGA